MPLLQVSPAGQGDDKATFLADFRALRARAELEYDELAARAHYPSDVLKQAEAGPGLPGLPVLTAYVRACGDDVPAWEERWRRLAAPASSASGLPTRPTGTTPAAMAGARASVSVTGADAHDPERIRAALRADREREEQAGRGRLAGTDRRLPVSAMDQRATTSPATMIANGSHHKKPWPDGIDTPATQAEAASASRAPTAAAPQVPSTAEDEFDAFRPTQTSSTTDTWPAFDPATASRADTGALRRDTAAASAWSTSADEPPVADEPSVWSPLPSAGQSFAWSSPASEPSAWSPADEPATPKATEWPAVGTERPRTARAETHGSRTEAHRAEAHGTRATQSARAKTKRSNHPGLLVALIVVVLIGCVALLMLT